MEDSGLFKFGGILNGGFMILKNKISYNRQSDYPCAVPAQEDCKGRPNKKSRSGCIFGF
jgi:hypothetical protein